LPLQALTTFKKLSKLKLRQTHLENIPLIYHLCLMGICIHYSGWLKTKKSLPHLIEEVRDIAESYKWQYHIFEEEFPYGSFKKPVSDAKAYGICFSPPASEPLTLTFASNGKLVSPWYLEHYFTDNKNERWLKGNSTKTHYSGVTIHKVVIHLFDYLSKKYLRNFKLYDEAQYWETRDEKLVQANFNYLNACMDSFDKALNTQPRKKGESFEKYFERLLHLIQKGKTKK
jgi:hypothetical protein